MTYKENPLWHQGCQVEKGQRGGEGRYMGVWSQILFPSRGHYSPLSPEEWHMCHLRNEDLHLHVYEGQQSLCSGKIN